MKSSWWRGISIIVIVLICLGGLAAGAIALAQSEAPTKSSEGPVNPAAPQALPAGGLAPDDNGYTGARQTTSPSHGPSSESQPGSASAPAEPAPAHIPQPDEDRFYAAGSETNQPTGWSTFYYLNISGSTLRPRSSTTGWSYGGGGCEYYPNASDLSNIHVDLPDKSRIDYLRVFYDDVDTSTNGTLYLTRYDGLGNFADLGMVSTAGNAGYGDVLSTFISVTVNTQAYSYVLNWDPGGENSSKLRLCGARIAYRLPIP